MPQAPSRKFDSIVGSRLAHDGLLQRPARDGVAGSGRFVTHRSPHGSRWLLLIGCAVLFLMSVTAVYVFIRLQELVPGTIQTAQSVCLAISRGKIPFDELCRN
jgi:hypothetical protein